MSVSSRGAGSGTGRRRRGASPAVDVALVDVALVDVVLVAREPEAPAATAARDGRLERADRDGPAGRGSRERAHPGQVPAEDQRLHGLGALVGVDDLDVAHVADHVVLQQHAVAAGRVA